MTDRELEMKLRTAVEHSAPDGLDRLLSDLDGKGAVNAMTNNKNKRKFRWAGLIAACLALVLIGGAGGLWYGRNYAVATVVSLDVNPSIELRVNSAEKVIKCTGLNDQARDILSSMGGGADLEGAKLSVAVNAIVGAIVQAGYLDSLNSAILISVEDNNTARASRLQAELVAAVDGVLKNASNAASVLSQNMNVDRDLTAQAQENNISAGKASLVNRVLDLNPELDFAALAQLSVEELRDLIKIGAPGMPIGRARAIEAVGLYTGTLGMSVADMEADPELDDPTPHYDVELRHIGDGDYEYRVDAFTGEVLSGPKDPFGPSSAGELVTSDWATNAALSYFNEKYPELAGYNPIGVNTTFDRQENEYDVDFWRAGWEFEYEIDAFTGEILSEDTDYRTPQAAAGDDKPDDTTDIGPDRAREIAVSDAGINGDVTWIRVERDIDDGRAVYDVEFTCSGQEYDYEIDAATGQVVKRESEKLPGQTAEPPATQQPSTQQPPAQQQPSTPAQPAVTDVGADAAKEAALKRAGVSAGDAVWVKCQREYDDGQLEYDIEFTAGNTEYEVTVDAATGQVTKYETEALRGSQVQDSSGDIGAEAAKAAALDHAGLAGSQVTGLKCERDRDDGRLVYEIEFRSGGFEYEYKIDATSGAVLEHERDRDD